MPFLIDGHNLIAFLPDITLEDPDDEAKLVNKLKGFAAGQRKKCTVIFDGGLPGGASRMSTRGVRVIFAAQGSNADSLIKGRIQKIRDARSWTVVTSDNEILRYARQRRMQTMSSPEFIRQLQARRPSSRRGEKENPKLSADEVEDWLEVFGGDDEGRAGAGKKTRKK